MQPRNISNWVDNELKMEATKKIKLHKQNLALKTHETFHKFRQQRKKVKQLTKSKNMRKQDRKICVKVRSFFQPVNDLSGDERSSKTKVVSRR